MRCLVVDDDQEFSSKFNIHLETFLKGIFKDFHIIEKFDDFSQYHDIDLLFIDIDLKDLNGINIIKRLQMDKVDYPIIYVSSRQELVFSSLIFIFFEHSEYKRWKINENSKNSCGDIYDQQSENSLSIHMCSRTENRIYQ